MRRTQNLPRSVTELLEGFRPCFTSRGFDTFVALVAGLIAAPARRTVCGLLTASAMTEGWHHSRAHRFFASTRWSPDELGLVILRLVIGWLLPVGAPVTVAVDDTLFRRRGRKVHAACWAYDGSRQVAAGQQKLSRGNTFVVAAIVVELPFLQRTIALPVLARLWRPGGLTKTALAKQLIRLIACDRPGRVIHVVADSAYLCTTLRHLPANVTLTGPLPRNAALWEIHPDLDNPPRGRRGRPRTRGAKIGTPDQLASTPGSTVTLTRYGRIAEVTIHERRCLWYGVFRSQPVRILLVREPLKFRSFGWPSGIVGFGSSARVRATAHR